MKDNKSLNLMEKELFDTIKLGFSIQQVIALNSFAGLKKRLSSEGNLVGVLIKGEGNLDAQLKDNLTKDEMESLMREIEEDNGKKIIYKMCLDFSRTLYIPFANKLRDPLYKDYKEEIIEYLDWCHKRDAEE